MSSKSVQKIQSYSSVVASVTQQSRRRVP